MKIMTDNDLIIGILLPNTHTHMYIHVITLRFYKRDGKGR